MGIYNIPGPVRPSDLICNKIVVAGNAALNGTSSIIAAAVSGDKVGLFGSSSTQLASVSDPDGAVASSMVDALNFCVTRLDAFGFLK